ncbi:hypothetical protein GALMADRAFT_255848 [Galerina marginata CBS 339.88]|uniref:Uncharacterized protein n=1 Tax=Galerina marginata (strain CBS 339.88) TaxID=685588 RepID=A0A067SPP4_GALM3|nr:hypothetical protein GALMADRAFT_255848 [Galerina marginata CBS 339.88]
MQDITPCPAVPRRCPTPACECLRCESALRPEARVHICKVSPRALLARASAAGAWPLRAEAGAEAAIFLVLCTNLLGLRRRQPASSCW